MVGVELPRVAARARKTSGLPTLAFHSPSLPACPSTILPLTPFPASWRPSSVFPFYPRHLHPISSPIPLRVNAPNGQPGRGKYELAVCLAPTQRLTSHRVREARGRRVSNWEGLEWAGGRVVDEAAQIEQHPRGHGNSDGGGSASERAFNNRRGKLRTDVSCDLVIDGGGRAHIEGRDVREVCEPHHPAR